MPFQARSTAVLASTFLLVSLALADPQAPPQPHHMMAAREPIVLLPVSTAHTFAELMANVDEVMHEGMADAPRNGDPDHDFASAMIPHHQGAVDMAKVELLYGRDPVLRRMAQEIIVSQQQEVEVMQRRIDTMSTTSPRPPTTSPKAP